MLEFLIGFGLGSSVGYHFGYKKGYEDGHRNATALCEDTYVTGGGETVIECGELRGHAGRHFPRRLT